VTPVALLVVEGQRGIVQELGEVVAAYMALADLELEATSASLALAALALAVLQSESRQVVQVVHNWVAGNRRKREELVPEEEVEEW
jgi:hypothetical protein